MKKKRFTLLEIYCSGRGRVKFQKGFTLAELMVVVTLLIIILGALVILYTTNHEFYNIASIFTELRGYTKNFKNQLSKDIEEAITVVKDPTTLLGTSYTTGTSELVFKCYGLDTNGDINPNINDYIAYCIDGTDIKRIVDADSSSSRDDSNRTLVEKVSSLTFEYCYYDSNGNRKSYSSDYTDVSDTTLIRSRLNLQKTSAGKTREEKIVSSAKLRNKR